MTKSNGAVTFCDTLINPLWQARNALTCGFVQDLPAGFDERDLLRAVRAFGVDPVRAVHAPVGFGDHHWVVTDDGGGRWFATLADLEHKEHCGHGATAALEGLRRAMETAAALREREELEFVVAPVRARDGRTVVPVGPRYALSLFPHVPGTPGRFGQEQSAGERDRVLAMLAALHGSHPPEPVPVAGLEVPGRDGLEAALAGAAGEWRGGPFSAGARELLREAARVLRARLRDFDELAARVRRRGSPPVVTHGEPHPGNLLAQAGGRCLLVDWDTVALAVPERDLAVVAADPGPLARYTELTGREVDADALALYRLRWALADVAEFAGWFQGPHEAGADTETAWLGLTATVRSLAGDR